MKHHTAGVGVVSAKLNLRYSWMFHEFIASSWTSQSGSWMFHSYIWFVHEWFMNTAEVHEWFMNDILLFLVHKSCINEWVHELYLVCERNCSVYDQFINGSWIDNQFMNTSVWLMKITFIYVNCTWTTSIFINSSWTPQTGSWIFYLWIWVSWTIHDFIVLELDFIESLMHWKNDSWMYCSWTDITWTSWTHSWLFCSSSCITVWKWFINLNNFKNILKSSVWFMNILFMNIWISWIVHDYIVLE